jgi:hypothetical protein
MNYSDMKIYFIESFALNYFLYINLLFFKEFATYIIEKMINNRKNKMDIDIYSF